MIPSFIEQPSAEDISELRMRQGWGIYQAQDTLVKERLRKYINRKPCLNAREMREILSYLLR